MKKNVSIYMIKMYAERNEINRCMITTCLGKNKPIIMKFGNYSYQR